MQLTEGIIAALVYLHAASCACGSKLKPPGYVPQVIAHVVFAFTRASHFGVTKF